MQEGTGFWVANILQVIAVLVAGFSGAWIATRWRFYREIRLGHFDKIKQFVILPLLHIFRTELLSKLDKSQSNVETATEDILNEEEKRIGVQYALKINKELTDFLQYDSYYGRSIRRNLLNDLMNHFPKSANLLQDFVSGFTEYNQRCLDTVKQLQSLVERTCKETIGFEETILGREFYNRPRHIILNSAGIAVWVYKKRLNIRTERLEKEHDYADYWALKEINGSLLAIGEEVMIKRLYDYSYNLAIITDLNRSSIDDTVKRMEQLLRMRAQICEQLEAIDSSNYLPGKCQFLKA